MKEVILIRIGEVTLKGCNRSSFEQKLVKNIRENIKTIGEASVFKSQGRIYVEPKSDDYNYKEAILRITNVFGIVSVSKSLKVESNFEEIKNKTLFYVSEYLKNNKNTKFKVESKRGDKSFPIKSPDLSSKIGAHLLNNISELTVDVRNPEFILNIEVRESTYIYIGKVKAHGGLPVGMSGKGLLLLSGGIDSPVAGWMMAKRGLKISAMHFYSYPFTSERSKDKVIELAKIISGYCMGIRLYIVHFTKIQTMINENFPHELSTIILRRFMMRVAQKVAKTHYIDTLITGESLGQVASQTIQGIHATNSVAEIPILRPLIGMDKQEIVDRAISIGTYDTSILPYEDCCTVFVAKHPKTKPNLGIILEYENAVKYDNLIDEAIDCIEVINL